MDKFFPPSVALLFFMHAVDFLSAYSLSPLRAAAPHRPSMFRITKVSFFSLFTTFFFSIN